MIRLKKVLIIVACIVLAIGIISFGVVKFLITPEKVVKSGQLTELTSEEKLEDFKYLYSTLQDSFPFFKVEKDKTGFDWLDRKDEFEKQIKATKNNEEFYHTLSGIVKMIQNGHTGVVTPKNYYGMLPVYDNFFNYPWKTVLTQSAVQEKYKTWNSIVNDNKVILPVKIRYIEGRYIVAEDFKNIKKGNIIDSINGKSIDEYFKSNLDKYYLNYDYKRDKLYVRANMILAEKDKEYKINFIAADGNKFTEMLTPIAFEQGSSAAPSISSSEEKILKENKVAYLKVSSMSNRTLQSDNKKILEFYKHIKNYPYLIIDIRGNGGGTDDYWRDNVAAPLISQKTSYDNAMTYKGDYIKPFLKGRGIVTKPIKELPNKFKSEYASSMERFITSSTSVSPQNTVDFRGKIYLLVDDAVYSSSESFAAFCKSTGFAELVGTNTGGDGIGIDPCVMALPNSGLVVRFSLDMGINSDGSVNEKAHTKPSIYAETTYEDFVKGEDFVLNKAVELCK